MMHGLLPVIAYVLTAVWAAGLWQGGLLALLGAALLRIMPRASATLRHGLLIVLFGLTVVLPWLPIRQTASPTHALHLSPWFAIAIAACWTLAALCRTVSLGIAWRHLRAVRHNAVPFTLGLEKADLGVRRHPVICTSADVDSPLIVGFFRPVLLLPEWLAPTLSIEQFCQIAVHECEHLRRHDDWTNLLLQVGLTLFPLNPALVWLNRRIDVQRELACDAAVVAATARPVDYAASLARIAEQHLHRNTLRLALAAWGRQSELSHRVHALLKPPRAWSSAQRRAATCAVSFVLLACGAALAHAPQLVIVETPAAMTMASTNSPMMQPSLVHPAAQALAGNIGASPINLVQTSFVAASGPPNRRTPKPLKNAHAQRRRTPRLVFTSEIVQTIDTALPRIVRTSASVADTSSDTKGQFQEAVHAVPTIFVPTYLAVHVSNGWVLIQL